MPPQLLFDISQIDLEKLTFGPDVIRECNPQRGDMEHLDGIVHVNPEADEIVGVKNVGPDEFWVPGHIPGRPLLPGVIMIEAGAQLASFYTRKYIGWKGFIGFGGVENCKFRSSVSPGERLYLLCKKRWERHHRISCDVQGLVNGTVVFECGIIGTEM